LRFLCAGHHVLARVLLAPVDIKGTFLLWTKGDISTLG
jgi:hypothetical protein